MPPALRRIERYPIEQKKHRRRQDQMRHDRVTREPIEPLLPSSEPQIFRDSHARGIDVETARGSPVEIVPRTVMPRMLPPPKGVRGQRHQAAHIAEDVVGPLRAEEGAVTASVPDDEDAHEKPGGA